MTIHVDAKVTWGSATREYVPIIVFVFAACFFILNAGGRVLADTPRDKSIDSYYRALSERVEKGVKGPIGGWHYYYTVGFHIDSREKNLEFDINKSILVNGGNIDADEELQRAFPDLDGSNILFRKLSVST
jgi:hypothetical protein